MDRSDWLSVFLLLACLFLLLVPSGTERTLHRRACKAELLLAKTAKDSLYVVIADRKCADFPKE